MGVDGARARPPEHDLRRIMDAVLNVDRTGIPWRYLPHDFALWETIYGYFAAWQKDGVFAQLNGVLRRLVREAEGRDAEPSACVLDTQSIKTSANGPTAAQGIDAGKKIAGRKRHIGVDTSASSWPCWSRPRASPTTPAASRCSHRSRTPTQA
jgi:transposase